MPITVNSNPAAAAANFYMSKNNSALQKSINRLSSGSKIVHPNDDAGGLAVSMKLESAVVRLQGAEKNIQNGISFLEVQDGVLANASKVMNRMIELKGLSQDVLKNSSDNDNYNREFRNLQVQLFEMGNLTFNGVSMFANFANDGTDAVFDDMNQQLNLDNTMSIYVSSDGSSGPKVSINKALLLSALSIDPNEATIGDGISYAAGLARDNTGTTFASQTYATAISLSTISVGVFTKALENLATLRADNGGTMSRLQYASDNATMQAKNFAAANGRIVDVDIAAESTNLAKYQILSQASASMIAQANSSMDIALMLLR
ncbi:flagellin [Opitutales bacterium]|nr:flagellin [Opitutales bacterium]